MLLGLRFRASEHACFCRPAHARALVLLHCLRPQGLSSDLRCGVQNVQNVQNVDVSLAGKVLCFNKGPQNLNSPTRA